jgi:hypothetical protein
VKKVKSLSKEQTMQAINNAYKKPSARATIPPEAKLLVSREEAAQLLSISQRDSITSSPIGDCQLEELAEGF